VALLQEIAQQLPAWMRWFQALAISLGSLGTAGGIIFAVYRFFKQDSHKPRLQPSIVGTLAISGGVIYLKVETAAQNLGNVPAKLNYEAPSLRILTRKSGDGNWTRHDTREVLVNERRIQPGETAIDYVWVELPEAETVALRLEMDVFLSEGSDQNAEVFSWTAIEVVNLVAQRNNVNMDYTESE
jgi:hypothetical protein